MRVYGAKNKAFFPGRVPLDKEKGFVKGENILSGAEHRFFCHPRESGTETLGISPLNHFSGGSLHRTIDTTKTTVHDSSIRTSSRRVCAEVGNPEVFPKALAPSSA